MSQFVQSFQKSLKQPGFLVAFIVLFLSAVGLNATAKFLKLQFKKKPVELSKRLENIPLEIGTWKCISKDQLSDEMEQELQTNKYVMRFYVDSSVIAAEDIKLYDGKSAAEIATISAALRDKYKDRFGRAIISFAVTYHTGKADTVAHIPERCYTADGFEPKEANEEIWPLPESKKCPGYENKVRYISFEDQSGRTRVQRNVAYFFNVNGRYESNPLKVRYTLQNLFQRYGYYAKIELMIQDPKREESAEAMQRFLKDAMPAIEDCFPNWADYEKKTD